MKDSYLVSEAQIILKVKSIETIRRYIRNNKDKTFEEIKKIQDKKEPGYYSLFLVNENSKPYRITGSSLLLLLQRRLGINDSKVDIAKAILDKYDDAATEVVHYINKPAVIETATDNDKLPNPFRSSNHSISHIYNDDYSKELYIKGLYLLQAIDGEIAAEEIDMINNRIALLGITQEDINKWVPQPDPQILLQNADNIIAKLVFKTRKQAVIFILEALRLAWQDGIYSQEEQELLIKYAKNNNINKESFTTFEKIIANEYDNSIVKEWQELLNN